MKQAECLSVAREGFDLLTEMQLQILESKNHSSEISFVLYSLTVKVGQCHLSPLQMQELCGL